MRPSIFFALFLSPLIAPFIALATPQSFDVRIDGMTCEACVKSLTSALQKLPQVQKSSVKVVLSEKKATLLMDGASAEGKAAVTKAITDAGYTVTSLNVSDAESATSEGNSPVTSDSATQKATTSKAPKAKGAAKKTNAI